MADVDNQLLLKGFSKIVEIPMGFKVFAAMARRFELKIRTMARQKSNFHVLTLRVLLLSCSVL